jgi:hypothetical protein
MAVITQNAVSGVNAPVILTTTTLSASDTLVYAQGTGQMLEIDNTTAGPLTVTLTGSTATVVTPSNYGGTFSVAGGFAITVAAAAKKIIKIDTIAPYLSGVVTLTGAATCTARLFA